MADKATVVTIKSTIHFPFASSTGVVMPGKTAQVPSSEASMLANRGFCSVAAATEAPKAPGAGGANA